MPISILTTDRFHHYRLEVDEDAARLFFDGREILKSEVGRTSKVRPNPFAWSDGKTLAGSEVLLKDTWFADSSRAAARSIRPAGSRWFRFRRENSRWARILVALANGPTNWKTVLSLN